MSWVPMGSGQALLDGVQEDEVPQDVPFDGQDEGMAAALQPLEEIGAAEAHEARAGAGQVGQHLGFVGRGRLVGRRFLVVAQTVARQRQVVDRVDHIVGKEAGVLVVWVLLVDLELDGLGNARREVGPGAVRRTSRYLRSRSGS